MYRRLYRRRIAQTLLRMFSAVRVIVVLLRGGLTMKHLFRPVVCWPPYCCVGRRWCC